MRRFWILIVVLAMALAMAGPATGKKPEGKPNPNAAPIAVHVENGPWMVHEVGDIIVYAVYVQNKTRTTPITVTVSNDFGVKSVTKKIVGGTTVPVVFEREVLKVPPYTTSGEIVDTITVTYEMDELDEEVTIVLEEGTLVESYRRCGFTDDGGTVRVDVTDGTACIWDTEERGAFTISVVPVDPKSHGMSVTLRDHVPGNWCTPDGSGGGAYVRWPSKDDAPKLLTLDVFLPDAEDRLDGGVPLGDGVCYGGGAGGATMLDGSPDSFYLWLTEAADVTISSTPE